MKKTITALFLIGSYTAYAGDMGPAAAPAKLPSYVSVEGGYAWNQIDGFRVDIVDIVTVFTEQKEHGGTGRLAIGAMNPIQDNIWLNGEIGWGYYGSVTMNPEAVGPATLQPGFPNLSAIDIKSTQTGFDVLAGVIYNQPTFDLFFKAGAMIENSTTKLNINFDQLSPTNLSGLGEFKLNMTKALPEIKLGASYHVTDALAVMASWTHVFGSNEKINILINPNMPVGALNLNLQDTTLDVALVGLRYQI